jgi:hypothetical protein
MGFPTPQFGAPLAPDQVNPELPFYPIYGVNPSNKYIPISIDSMGRLNVNATLSGSVTIGEIGNPDESSFSYGATLEQTVGGVYQDTNPTLPSGTQGAVRLTQYRAFHVNLRDSSGIEISPSLESTQLAVKADLDKFQFSTGGALLVTNTETVGTSINKYAENTTVPAAILTTILTYTVPAGKTLDITGVYGWGQCDGEFLIKVDSVIVGGGWSSPSFRTLRLDYTAAPILANAGQIVTVNVIQYQTSTQDFKANLLGTLN